MSCAATSYERLGGSGKVLSQITNRTQAHLIAQTLLCPKPKGKNIDCGKHTDPHHAQQSDLQRHNPETLRRFRVP